MLLFFCDEGRGPQWAGWWFGPEQSWEHPGWARHGDTQSTTPPTFGWQVPPDGPVDLSLRLALAQTAVQPAGLCT